MASGITTILTCLYMFSSLVNLKNGKQSGLFTLFDTIDLNILESINDANSFLSISISASVYLPIVLAK